MRRRYAAACLQRNAANKGIVAASARARAAGAFIDMTDSASPRGGQPLTGLLPVLALLCLSGIALRIPILAIPPLLPMIHDTFHMTEAQVGLLVGLPLALFALAAVPGSLLVARLGSATGRWSADCCWPVWLPARAASSTICPALYLATIVMGFGISVMQPALPRLVREWTPGRIGLGTAVYTNGMLIGAVTPIALTSLFGRACADGGATPGAMISIFWAVPVLMPLNAALWSSALPMLPTARNAMPCGCPTAGGRNGKVR